MSLLVILGIWIAISAVVAPVVGYFLAGPRATQKPVQDSYDLDLSPHSQRKA